MTEIWVDTDFGFDDIWALLLLRKYRAKIVGVSLTAGNTNLEQVVANALGAKQAYDLDMRLWRGADKPLKRIPETAQNILGPTGIRSRGRRLPASQGHVADNAVEALRSWLMSAGDEQPRVLLALGPLTNIAHLVTREPEAASKITRLIWMGGSNGPGNQTKAAEFNAFADPEALNIVANAGLAMDIVDLTFCRNVVFGPDDMPATDALTSDLLGGYLDIAMERGRDGMAIYDPLAALAISAPNHVQFEPHSLSVEINDGPEYGATRFSPLQSSLTRLAVKPDAHLAQICLAAISHKVTARD